MPDRVVFDTLDKYVAVLSKHAIYIYSLQNGQLIREYYLDIDKYE